MKFNGLFSYLPVEIKKIKPREKLSCQIRGIKYLFLFFFQPTFFMNFCGIGISSTREFYVFVFLSRLFQLLLWKIPRFTNQRSSRSGTFHHPWKSISRLRKLPKRHLRKIQHRLIHLQVQRLNWKVLPLPDHRYNWRAWRKIFYNFWWTLSCCC